MKKLFALFLLLSLTIVFLSGCGKSSQTTQALPQTQQSKGTLKIALDTAYRPMEWEENGAIVGFDADLMKAIGKEMGREVEFKSVPWNDIFDKLYAHEFDLVISAVSINDERKKSMLFSNPYFDSMPVILTKKDMGIKSAQDLSKKKIAVQEGTTALELISKNIAGVDIKKFDVATDALNSFEKNEVDAVVLDSPVILDFAKQKNNSEYTVVEYKKFFSQEQFGIASNISEDRLITEINTALSKVKANGEYEKIYDKYFKVN